jgi:dCMP deaminase
MERRDKNNYYLDISEKILERGTCIRRIMGAVVVKNDEIIATGYNGAPRGMANCSDLGYCLRQKMEIKKGERYELCRAVHAEANAIISASRADLLGATMYLSCHNMETGELFGNVSPCKMCTRLIINAGIERVIVRNTPDEYTIFSVEDWIKNDNPLDISNGY